MSGLRLFVCCSSIWCTGTPNTPASARPPVSLMGSPWWESSCRSVFLHPSCRLLSILSKVRIACPFFIQTGNKNESLQKVLDKFNTIKAKVSEEDEDEGRRRRVFISSSSFPVISLTSSGQTDHLCRFRPYCLAPRLSGLLDVRGLSDHAPSAGERHLDRLQRAHLRQLRAGIPRWLWNDSGGIQPLMFDFNRSAGADLITS